MLITNSFLYPLLALALSQAANAQYLANDFDFSDDSLAQFVLRDENAFDIVQLNAALDGFSKKVKAAAAEALRDETDAKFRRDLMGIEDDTHDLEARAWFSALAKGLRAVTKLIPKKHKDIPQGPPPDNFRSVMGGGSPMQTMDQGSPQANVGPAPMLPVLQMQRREAEEEDLIDLYARAMLAEDAEWDFE